MNIIFFFILSSSIFSFVPYFCDGDGDMNKRQKRVHFVDPEAPVIGRTKSEAAVANLDLRLPERHRFDLDMLSSFDSQNEAETPVVNNQPSKSKTKPPPKKSPGLMRKITNMNIGIMSAGRTKKSEKSQETNVKKVISFKDANEAFKKLKTYVSSVSLKSGNKPPVEDYLNTINNYLEEAFLPEELKIDTSSYKHVSTMDLKTALREVKSPISQINTPNLRDYLDICNLYSIRSIQDEVIEKGIVQETVIASNKKKYIDTILNSFKVLSGSTQISLMYPLFELYKAIVVGAFMEIADGVLWDKCGSTNTDSLFPANEFNNSFLKIGINNEKNENHEQLVQKLNEVTFSPYWNRIRPENLTLTTFMFEKYVKTDRQMPMTMKDEYKQRANAFCSTVLPAYTSRDEKNKFETFLKSITNGETKIFLDTAQKYSSNYMYNDFPVFDIGDTSDNDEQFRITAVEMLRTHFVSVLRIYSQFISIIFEVKNYKDAGFDNEAQYFNFILDEFMAILQYARSFKTYSIYLKDTTVIPMEKFILNIQMLTFKLRSYLANFITEFVPKDGEKPDANFYNSKLKEYNADRYTAIHYIMVQNEENRHNNPYWKDFSIPPTSEKKIFDKPLDLLTLTIGKYSNNAKDKINLLQLERMSLIAFMKTVTSIRATKEPEYRSQTRTKNINDLKFGKLFPDYFFTYDDMEDLKPKTPYMR